MPGNDGYQGANPKGDAKTPGRGFWQGIEPAVRLFERIYPLIKRRHHNVLAWAVIIAGLAVAAGPVWEPYLRGAASTYFNFTIPESPNPWVGVVLIVVGLTYHFFTMRFDSLIDATRGESILDHDAALYMPLTAILTDEWLYRFLGNLGDDHSYYREDSERLTSALKLLVAPNKLFLSPDMRKTAQNLASAVYAIQQFLAYRFFHWPPNQRRENTRYCMQPMQSLDRGGDGSDEQMQFYEGLTNELKGLIDQARGAYEAFTNVAHSRLGKRALNG